MENRQLALAGGRANHLTVCKHFTRRTWKALTVDAGGMEIAVRAITDNPDLLDEVKAQLPALEAAAAPAGADFVNTLLTEVGVICGVPWDDPRTMALAKGEYIAILGELPREALRQGVDAFKRSDLSNYGFPKPARLLTFAEPFASEIRIALGRAKAAAKREATGARKVTPEDRKAEIERLKAEGVLDANGKVILNFKTPPPPPPPAESAAAVKERAKAIMTGGDPHLQRLKDAPIRRGANEFE